MSSRDVSPLVPGRARTTRFYEPKSPRYALALLAGGILGACSTADVHSARPVRLQGVSSPVVLQDGGLRTDAGAVEPNPGADASTVWIFLHTGQSLSVGLRADTSAPRTPATASAPGHYMLLGQQDGGGALGPLPWSLTTLANPCRALGVSNVGIYPTNIWDEVPMVAMGARLSVVTPGVVSAHEVFGINGQPIYTMGPDDQGANGSFLGLAMAVREFARLVRALGKTPRVAAIVHTHGETDNGNPDYKTQLGTYRNQIEALAQSATGQTDTIPMFLTQASAVYPPTTGAMNTTWQDMVDLAQQQPEAFVLAGPKYALSYDPGDFHLDVPGSRDLGYLYADAWAEWRRHRTFPTRAPVEIIRGATTLDIRYDLAAGEALTWDTSLWAGNHSAVWTEWASAKGFELLDAGSNVVDIDGATLTDSRTVRLTRAAGWPAGALYLSYAHYGDTDTAVRRGQLRTSSGRWAPHSFATVP